jgi:hypothetical protein
MARGEAWFLAFVHGPLGLNPGHRRGSRVLVVRTRLPACCAPSRFCLGSIPSTCSLDVLLKLPICRVSDTLEDSRRYGGANYGGQKQPGTRDHSSGAPAGQAVELGSTVGLDIDRPERMSFTEGCFASGDRHEGSPGLRPQRPPTLRSDLNRPREAHGNCGHVIGQSSSPIGGARRSGAAGPALAPLQRAPRDRQSPEWEKGRSRRGPQKGAAHACPFPTGLFNRLIKTYGSLSPTPLPQLSRRRLDSPAALRRRSQAGAPKRQLLLPVLRRLG